MSSLIATELGAAAIEGALRQCHLDPVQVDEAFIGNVLSANLGQVRPPFSRGHVLFFDSGSS